MPTDAPAMPTELTMPTDDPAMPTDASAMPPGLPSREQCVIRELLRRRAAGQPDAEFVLFDGGDRWTWADALERVQRAAAGLHALGVRPGDFVLSWQGNGPSAVTTFLALNWLGAVYVPLNTAYRGALLEHVVRRSGARTMIADGRLIGRLAEIGTGALQTLVVVGDERIPLPGVRCLPDTLMHAGGALPPAPDFAPWDTHMVIFTSGTTGPSKGVLASYVHSYTAALGFRNVGPGDRSLMQLPMFHVGGPYALLWALIHGGSTVVVDAFSVTRFWDLVRRHEVTTVGLLGAMAQFLLKQPPSSGDREHTLRSVIIAPFDETAIAFGERFNVPTFTEFNMTELSVPLWAGPNPTLPRTCGQPQAGVELRLVDENDLEVPVGQVGELIVRADQPWTLSHGYLNDADATARAWRNGWFHTGDLFRRDAHDNYFFIDRAKDVLRRRGENISSAEVEGAIQAHPSVREAAVVPVAGDGGEDEVLAVVVPVAGVVFDPASLITDLCATLPYFMVPRFVRVLDALPKTPTQKVEKHVLRAEGVTACTWDREAAGIRVERDRLTAR